MSVFKTSIQGWILVSFFMEAALDIDTPCSGFSFEDASDMQYTLDTPGRRILGEMRSGQTPFLTTAAQLERFLAEINNTSKCKAESCNGILVLELVGNGGDGTAFFLFGKVWH